MNAARSVASRSANVDIASAPGEGGGHAPGIEVSGPLETAYPAPSFRRFSITQHFLTGQSTPGGPLVLGRRRTMTRAVLIGVLMAGAIAVVLLNRDVLGDAGDTLQALPAAVAVSAAVHAVQIALAGAAWRVLLPPAVRPPIGVMAALRWYREAANTLLPAGAIVGQTASARLLARRRAGGRLAAATATVDLTAEAVSQALFTLAGVGLLVASAHPSRLTAWAAAGIVMLAVAAILMVALQRRLPLGLLRPVLRRLERRWPAISAERLQAFQATLLSVHAGRRALVFALLLHTAAWALGAVEFILVFGLLGRAVSLGDAVITESVAQALRNVGFMLPGAFAVQEGAIVAAAALVGIAPATALTAALVRRAREVAIGLPGLLAWWHAETGGSRTQPARTPT